MHCFAFSVYIGLSIKTRNSYMIGPFLPFQKHGRYRQNIRKFLSVSECEGLFNLAKMIKKDTITNTEFGNRVPSGIFQSAEHDGKFLLIK